MPSEFHVSLPVSPPRVGSSTGANGDHAAFVLGAGPAAPSRNEIVWPIAAFAFRKPLQIRSRLSSNAKIGLAKLCFLISNHFRLKTAGFCLPAIRS